MMFKPIMDLAGGLVQPLRQRLNIPRFSVNPRTGKVQQIKQITATGSSSSSTAPARALPAGTDNYWIKGSTVKGDDKKLEGVSVSAYVTTNGVFKSLNLLTISKDDGTFALPIPRTAANVVLLCSAPGMRTTKFHIDRKSDLAALKIKLLEIEA